MEKVSSADGTEIAYDTFGQGPGLILIAGAFTDRSYYVPLATALSSAFTVVTYDRRGRGDSGDSSQYEIEREIEDLSSLRQATDAVFGYADSSGVMLLLRAVAAGVPFEKLTIMEPPFRGEGAPPVPDRYVERLQEFITAGNPGGAVELFIIEAVGQPPSAVEEIKPTPMWPALEAMAHTLLYDAHLMGDSNVPTDLLAQIPTPTLAIHSTSSPAWLQDATKAAAEALPNARVQGLPGQFHQVPPETLAPALTDFYL
jgi:pimeloyl-ACP methyl ester carboxylesterase